MPAESEDFGRLVDLVVDGDAMAFAAAFRLPWPFSHQTLPDGRIRIVPSLEAERSPV